jgi:type I restriction enzyme S subunit
VNGPFGSDLLTSELKSEGVPVIYVRDIKEGAYLRVSTVHVTEEKASQLSFCDVQFGDVLVAKVGDPPCDAAPYLSPEKAIITQDGIRIRPARHTDSRFLSYVINSSFGRLGVRGIVIEATRARVSLRDFKRVCVPKPSFAEQMEISRRLAAQEQRIAAEFAQLTKFRLIKVGLMNDLLTGKVRVPSREAAS